MDKRTQYRWFRPYDERHHAALHHLRGGGKNDFMLMTIERHWPRICQIIEQMPPAHLCPDWDFMQVRPTDPERKGCSCHAR
jgi:hypothetical protein